MARFARIGVAPGKTIDVASLSPETRKAMEDGIADAWQAFDVLRQESEIGKITSADLFGTREYLKSNYLHRMMGAVNRPGGISTASPTHDSSINGISPEAEPRSCATRCAIAWRCSTASSSIWR